MVKLLIYALLAFIAWQFVRRLIANLAAGAAANMQKQSTAGRPAEPPRQVAQDLTQCAVCGTYVAARCARTNCPQ